MVVFLRRTKEFVSSSVNVNRQIRTLLNKILIVLDTIEVYLQSE